MQQNNFSGEPRPFKGSPSGRKNCDAVHMLFVAFTHTAFILLLMTFHPDHPLGHPLATSPLPLYPHLLGKALLPLPNLEATQSIDPNSEYLAALTLFGDNCSGKHLTDQNEPPVGLGVCVGGGCLAISCLS